MNKQSFLSLTQSLPYFSRADLGGLGVEARDIDQSLLRLTQRGELIRLKRGLYTTKHYILDQRLKQTFGGYVEFIANILVSPSYITAEYVLAKHELLTEGVQTITSFTTGRPCLITNQLGNFRYRNISNAITGNFETKSQDGFLIKEATKVQALFDYLYMKKKQFKELSLQNVQELRLNLQHISNHEFALLLEMVSEVKSPRLKKIIRILKEAHAIEGN